MLETTLEKTHNDSNDNNNPLYNFPLQLFRFPRPDENEVYSIKYINSQLKELILKHQEQKMSLKCIPWKSRIDIKKLTRSLNRPILAITAKDGNFMLNNHTDAQLFTKKPICVYQNNDAQYFLLSEKEASNEILNALYMQIPKYVKIPKIVPSFYNFYMFVGIAVIILFFAFYCSERKDHLNRLKNDLAILNRNLTFLLKSLEDWEKNIIHKNNNLISLGGFDFTENIQYLNTKCRTFVASNQNLIAKIFPSLIVSFNNIVSSTISLFNIISSSVFKPSVDVKSVEDTIKECHKETLQLTEKIDTAIYNLSVGVIKKLPELAENTFPTNTSSETPNQFYWLAGSFFIAAVAFFLYFRVFNKPKQVQQPLPIPQPSPIPAAPVIESFHRWLASNKETNRLNQQVNMLERKTNNLRNQVTILNDKDMLRQSINSDNQQLTSILTDQIKNLAIQLNKLEQDFSKQKTVGVENNLEDIINNLELRINTAKNEQDQLKQQMSELHKSTDDLENRTTQLENAHQSIKQEIRHTGSISSEARQKMQDSPPRLLSNRYVKTSPIRGGFNPEPDSQSTLNNNNAAT